MKKIVCFLGIMIALLFIVSCVPVAKYYVCSDGKKVLNADECSPVKVEEEPPEQTVTTEPAEEKETPVEVVLSDAAKALLDKSQKAVGLEYGYVESPALLPENMYWTTKEKMKITLKSKIKFNATNSYDTVYLDLVQKTAIAYCEDKDTSICPDKNKIFHVAFDQFFVETPFDWLSKITKADLTGKSKIYAGRTAVEMSFEIDGQKGTMFMDAFFGIPLQITFGDKNYDFTDLTVNEVKATDLEHQFPQ